MKRLLIRLVVAYVGWRVRANVRMCAVCAMPVIGTMPQLEYPTAEPHTCTHLRKPATVAK